MKSQKPHDTTPRRKKRASHASHASVKALNRYLDEEVTLIHENLDELKAFLSQHASLTANEELHPDEKNVDEYFNSADDLFRQVALETDNKIPLEAQWYETFILRRKKKDPASGSEK